MNPRAALAVLAGVAVPLLAGCSQARTVPVVSECPGHVRATFAGSGGAGWNDPIEVGPDGTALSVSLEVDRVWFESTDGEVLNEVSLTADQLADPDVDFPALVIRGQDCGELEAAS